MDAADVGVRGFRRSHVPSRWGTLQLRRALADAPEALRADLGAAQAIARENLNEVQRIARRLRPTMLDDLGLSYALLSLADVIEEQVGFPLVRHVDTDAPCVSDAAELGVYRIAQEALTNVLRHADASRIELVFRPVQDGEHVLLAIHDDGRGMVLAPGVEGGGIRGMRERALAIDGQLSIDGRPGVGTNVILIVPAQR